MWSLPRRPPWSSQTSSPSRRVIKLISEAKSENRFRKMLRKTGQNVFEWDETPKSGKFPYGTPARDDATTRNESTHSRLASWRVRLCSPRLPNIYGKYLVLRKLFTGFNLVIINLEGMDFGSSGYPPEGGAAAAASPPRRVSKQQAEAFMKHQVMMAIWPTPALTFSYVYQTAKECPRRRPGGSCAAVRMHLRSCHTRSHGRSIQSNRRGERGRSSDCFILI